ncbi:MAG: class I SAM-dependent methyltransferase [Elusimicrobia bacterium]|nr:class I SAM-dependent methyltransferase [Elusimicrobiota bacterium]
MSDWTGRFFRAPIFTPGAAEALAAAPMEAAAVWRSLKLRPGARVLDLACGTGRHSIPLARRGAFVVGVDRTASYLKEARRAARGLSNCLFARGDMRRLPFEGEFDAVINLWTSFGYFAKPSDDLKVLRGAARALKPGGLFLIDLLDFAWVKRSGQRRRWDRREDGAYLLQEADWTMGRDARIVNDWTILRPGKPALRCRFVVRGYDKPRLYAALRRAGLEPVKSWSGLGALARVKSSGRLVVLARKPAR